MTAVEVFDLLNRGGVLALLALILLGGHRRWWVFGWAYRETLAREQEWKQLALTGTKIAERFTRQGERGVDETIR